MTATAGSAWSGWPSGRRPATAAWSTASPRTGSSSSGPGCRGTGERPADPGRPGRRRPAGPCRARPHARRCAAAGDRRRGRRRRTGLEVINRVHRDVVLMDIRMPGMDGLAATQRPAERADPPKVIVLPPFDADEYVAQARAQGAPGFLLKDTPPP